MTQRQRHAIVRYWLSKNWSAPRRRLLGRYFIFAAALLVLFPGRALAKDTKTLMSVLDSKAVESSRAKTKAIEKAEASKTAKKFPKEAKQSAKTVTGTVVSVRKTTMSVQTGESEANGAEEMLFRIDAGTKAKGVKKLSDLKYGDEVKVSYLFTVLPPKVKDGEPEVLDVTASQVERTRSAAEMAQAAAITAVPAISAPAEGALRAK